MHDDAASRFSLKDHLFNRERVTYLAGLFRAADRRFRKGEFIKAATAPFNSLELKQRIAHIGSTLESYLDRDFTVAAKQIVAALPAPLDPTRTDDDFGDFIFAPLGEYVVRNGLQKRHLSLSLRTLKELTQRFSMEDAIRAFINEFPDETFKELTRWVDDKHYHVRRLVSEGTRPRLPWSQRLNISPDRPLPLLDRLHADPTRYVTRSVSNHLNDLSRSDPDLVLTTLSRWASEQRQNLRELQWMTRHALRTLVKKGHADALALLGFTASPRLQLTEFRLTPRVIQAGEAFELTVRLQSQDSQQLVIDYELDFAKAGGRRSSKVYSVKRCEVEKGQVVTITKRHILRANATTYRLYSGTHHVTLKINGQPCGKRSFNVTVP